MPRCNILIKTYGQELKSILFQLYINERKTMREIGDVLGVDAVAIYYHLKKFEIPTRDRHDHPVSDVVIENARRLGQSMKGTKRTAEVRNKISISKRGKMLKQSKYGGHCKDRYGYVYVYCPSHPNCSADGYVMEHRLAVESQIGRYLNKDEVVHHINKNKKDNRIENLMILTRSEHATLHGHERKKTNELNSTFRKNN